MEIIPISVKTTELDIDTKIQNSGIVDLNTADTKPVSVDVQAQPIAMIQTAIESQGFVNIGVGGQDMVCNRVLYKTTNEWNRDKNLMSVAGVIYIYSDRMPAPGIKIGTGRSLLYDLPFLDNYILDHINNREIHVTKTEKTFWNNKETSKVVNGNLIFSKE